MKTYTSTFLLLITLILYSSCSKIKDLIEPNKEVEIILNENFLIDSIVTNYSTANSSLKKRKTVFQYDSQKYLLRETIYENIVNGSQDTTLLTIDNSYEINGQDAIVNKFKIGQINTLNYVVPIDYKLVTNIFNNIVGGNDTIQTLYRNIKYNDSEYHSHYEIYDLNTSITNKSTLKFPINREYRENIYEFDYLTDTNGVKIKTTIHRVYDVVQQKLNANSNWNFSYTALSFNISGVTYTSPFFWKYEDIKEFSIYKLPSPKKRFYYISHWPGSNKPDNYIYSKFNSAMYVSKNKIQWTKLGETQYENFDFTIENGIVKSYKTRDNNFNLVSTTTYYFRKI